MSKLEISAVNINAIEIVVDALLELDGLVDVTKAEDLYRDVAAPIVLALVRQGLIRNG